MHTVVQPLSARSDRLVDWSRRHSLVILAATVLAVAFTSIWWLAALASLSFAALVREYEALHAPPASFGWANRVTALRLVGTLALPALATFGPLAVAAGATVVFALDGVDGWIARRSGLASEFGEYFDKESDALLMLVLCLLLYEAGRFGAWILLPGLLRYGFVVFLMLARPPEPKERRSGLGRWIFFGTTSALIASFTPFPAWYEPLMAAMTFMLAASFFVAIVELYRVAPVGTTAAPVRLRTRAVHDSDDVVDFFDALAPEYRDCHGDVQRALHERLALIGRLLPDRRSRLLEIGCGNAMHLLALAPLFEASIGVDVSPRMIAAARSACAQRAERARVRFAVERAERLSSVAADSVDLVLCVGAFEHMIDQAAVLAEVARVLRPRGVFVCLSPNADYVWYAHLAPWLGLDTRHLSTDRFVAPARWPLLLGEAGLDVSAIGFWRFVPAGDMPPWAASTMRALDRLGSMMRIDALRGGCYVRAVKPADGSALFSPGTAGASPASTSIW